MGREKREKGKITNNNEICMKISHGSLLLCKLILKIQKRKRKKSKCLVRGRVQW